MTEKSRSGQISRVAEQAASRLIDSRRLLYFYHVARSGSFSAAETALDIAQSALSRQIRQLESDLGAKLLERRGHGVEMTAAGRTLLEHAEEVLNLMGTAIDEVELTGRAPRDRVALAVSRPFSTKYIPKVLSKFTDDHPRIHVSVYEASSGQVYEMLTGGVVDLAVVLAQANSPKISTVKLFEEELLVTGWNGHPALQKSAVKRGDLQGIDLMLPAAPFGTRALIEEYCKQGGFDIDPTLRFDSVSLMIEMIRSTGRCALLPRSACEDELISGEFVAKPLKPALRRTQWIASLRDHKQPEPINALRNAILDVVLQQGA